MLRTVGTVFAANLAWLLAYTALGQAYALAVYRMTAIHLPFGVELSAALISGVVAAWTAVLLDRQRRSVLGASGGLMLLVLLARTPETPMRLSAMAGAGALGLVVGTLTVGAWVRTSTQRKGGG